MEQNRRERNIHHNAFEGIDAFTRDQALFSAEHSDKQHNSNRQNRTQNFDHSDHCSFSPFLIRLYRQYYTYRGNSVKEKNVSGRALCRKKIVLEFMRYRG